MLLRLKVLLMERRMTQRSLARAVGVDYFRLSRIVSGRVRAWRGERSAIAAALGVAVSEIFPHLSEWKRKRAQRRRKARQSQLVGTAQQAQAGN